MRRVSRKQLLWVLVLLAAAAASVLVLRFGSGPDAGETSRPRGAEAPEEAVLEDRTAREAPEVEAPAESEAAVAPSAAHDASDSADEPSSQAQEASSSETEERTFVMPEGASYEPEVALVTFAEGATVDEVNALLAQSDAVATKQVSEEDLARGYIELELAEGASVEETVNELLVSGAIDIAQPNFYYYPQHGDEGDFRALLADDLAPAAVTDGSDETGADEPDQADASADTTPEPSSGEGGSGTEEGTPDTVEDASGTEEGTPDSATDPASSETEAPDLSASQEEPEAGNDHEAEAPADPANPAEPDPRLAASDLMSMLDVNDPIPAERDLYNWNLTQINAYAAWSVARCEGSVAVAVMDEHPDYTHEDLAANVVGTYDAATGADTYAESSFERHGTHVAGVVGAVANNGVGMAGVSYNAGLVLINVKSATGAISSASLKAAYDYVLSKRDALNIRIANVSIAGAQSNPVSADQVLVRCISDAYQQGVISVVASGNSPLKGTGGKTYEAPYYSYPGDTEQAVSVINLEDDGTGALVRSESSNYNVAGQKEKNISAPGGTILGTFPNNDYGCLSGTSMATPHVAGVLALEFAANPNLTVSEAVSVLYATACDLGDEGWDEGYGYGAVDAWRAVAAATDPEVVAQIMAGGHYAPDLPEAPMPSVSGATRIPVFADASYRVTNGSLKLKAGTDATLVGSTLTGLSPGKVTLAVLDVAGVERQTFEVEVYALSGWYKLTSAANAKLALNVRGGYVANSTNINLATASGARHQAWRFEEQTDCSYVIRNAKSGKLVHVAWGSAAHGANVIQYPQNDMLWQQWRMEVDAQNYVSFVSDESGLVLGVAGTAKSGANVQQQDPTGAAGQKWQLTKVSVDVGPIWDGVYKVSSGLNTSYALEVARASKANGANVQLGKATSSKGQKWLFTYLGDGVYKVRPMCATKVLTVTRGKKAAGTNVVQGKWGKASWQKWKVVKNDDDSCTLYRSGTRLVLATQGTKAKAGLNVCQAKLKADARSQTWWLRQY